MPDDPTARIRFSLRLPPHLHLLLREICEKTGRSMNDEILEAVGRHILVSHLPTAAAAVAARPERPERPRKGMLTDAEKQNVAERMLAGETYADIARDFDLSRQRIHQIVRAWQDKQRNEKRRKLGLYRPGRKRKPASNGQIDASR